jgi:hypothetical protein
VSLPPKKKMKGREECEMLEVLLTFQVQVLKQACDSSSNAEKA